MSIRTISFRDFDWLLLGVLLLISTLGVVEIYSTTVNTPFAGAHTKQIAWIAIGLALMFLLCRYDYHELLNHVPLFYLGTLGLLAGVLIVGTEIMGAKRWIRMGGFSFQVAEIAKLVLILLLARFFSETEQRGVSRVDFLKVAVVAGIPFLLIAAQPDLGSALTLIPIAATMLFLAGFKLRYFALLTLAGLLALPVTYHFLKPYQKARLATFLNPEEDPRNSGYQLLQSKIAVGSGQIWGKGTGEGSQTQLRFLPVPHTDFIFAAYSEEHGFIGVLLALSLYFFVLMRLLRAAATAPDSQGYFLIGGIAGILVFQILVNVGMVVGYVPVTGIPLPLMSYGGSSVVFIWMAMGLVNSVRLRRFVN
ncbi:MAG: rod shape-determining protein RodA [Acidobacteria bacterium]|nr:rod shape-determining protein RodA [Acidobacteriota bacterium]